MKGLCPRVMKGFFRKFKDVKARDILHIFLFILALPIGLAYKLKRRNLWLFSDNGREGSDNGFVLFKYVCENHPGEDAVYAICKESIDYDKVNAVGKTVQYGSFMHWVLYITARVNISSQKGGKPNYAVCNLLEVHLGMFKNRVFLQHGVILTDIKFLYKENAKFSLFVTSTKDEWEYVSKNYGYTDGEVKLLGLPRFDLLHGRQTTPNTILIMPTWREWLGTDSLSKNHAKDIEGFKNTKYFKNWNSLLNSAELQAVCEKYGLKVLFYLHRDAQRFSGCFCSDNPYLTVCKYPEYTADELLKSSACLITDFSSVQADFAYMKKPLCYFHFDYDEYTDKHYGKGYFDYQRDGFGPVFSDTDQIVKYVASKAENGFKNCEPYISRHKKFFTLYDRGNCKRNYEAIKEKWS